MLKQNKTTKTGVGGYPKAFRVLVSTPGLLNSSSMVRNYFNSEGTVLSMILRHVSSVQKIIVTPHSLPPFIQLTNLGFILQIRLDFTLPGKPFLPSWVQDHPLVCSLSTRSPHVRNHRKKELKAVLGGWKTANEIQV